jgi:hypothetical protein
MSEKFNWKNISAAIVSSTVIGLSSCGYTEKPQGPNATALEQPPTKVKSLPEKSVAQNTPPPIETNTQSKKLPLFNEKWTCNEHLLNFPFSYSTDRTKTINPINEEEGNKKTINCLFRKGLLAPNNKYNPEKIAAALAVVYKRNEKTPTLKCEEYLTTFTQSLCAYRWQKINFPKAGVTHSPTGFVGLVTKKAATKLGVDVQELYDIGG